MDLSLRKTLIFLIGIGILVGSGYAAKTIAEKKAPPKKKENPAPVIREVAVFQATNGKVSSEMEVQGSLIAYNKVDIFAEVTGMLENTAKPFKVGSYFKKGEILLDIEDDEARLNILSQKSNLVNAITLIMPDLKIDYPQSFQQWKAYLDKFNVETSVLPLPKPLNDQEKYFIATKNLASQYYAIKSAEKRLGKYTVYAPFSGVISEAMINPGSLVRAGQKMGSLMGTGDYEMQATVSLEDLKFIKTGTKVQLYSDAAAGNWTGTVRRVSDMIDANTQSVLVFIGVKGKGLREGMYLKGKLNTRAVDNAISLPLDLLVNQNQVYVVDNDKLRLQEVEVLNTDATNAVVQGLPEGALLVKNQLVGAFEGMDVKTVMMNDE